MAVAYGPGFPAAGRLTTKPGAVEVYTNQGARRDRPGGDLVQGIFDTLKAELEAQMTLRYLLVNFGWATLAEIATAVDESGGAGLSFNNFVEGDYTPTGAGAGLVATGSETQDTGAEFGEILPGAVGGWYALLPDGFPGGIPFGSTGGTTELLLLNIGGKLVGRNVISAGMGPAVGGNATTDDFAANIREDASTVALSNGDTFYETFAVSGATFAPTGNNVHLYDRQAAGSFSGRVGVFAAGVPNAYNLANTQAIRNAMRKAQDAIEAA